MGDFFKRLTACEAYFKNEGQKILYSKGKSFVRPEDSSPWVYFLDSGLVEIAYGFSDGSNRLLGYFFPGVIFAQNGSFFANDGSGLEYLAAKDSVAYRIPIERFFEILAQQPECNMEYTNLLLCNQFLLIERVAYMGERSIERMVIRLITGLGKYYGHKEGAEHVVDVPITQEIIARFTHATRESVSKTLRRLNSEGTISVKKKCLTIHNMRKLEQMLSS